MKNASALNIRSVGIIDSSGKLVSTDGFIDNVKEKEYVKNILTGTKDKYINETRFIKGIDDQIIFVAVPI